VSVLEEIRQGMTRRLFLRVGSHLLGTAALASLDRGTFGHEVVGQAHVAPRAKHVIYLHMVGGSSQMDLLDYKPVMGDWYDKDLPASIRMGQTLTTMSSEQARFPIAPSIYQFERCGHSGMWISELLPWLKKSVDDVTFVRSMHTDAINHEPAITLMQTGNSVTGKPCMGAWCSYGLGSLNDNLPTFVVMVARSTKSDQSQAISARLWGSGFLPGHHAGVSIRTAGDPILFIKDPAGLPREVRRMALDGINQLNEMNFREVGDAQTHTRIQQYELAYRMQASVPELADLSSEQASTFALYGEEARVPGTFANTTLLARRMVERGVRFIQIYHNNWDSHANVTGRLPDQCRDVDRACHGLISDLKQRGLLDETIVIWGGEFGRTIYSQGDLTKENYGRDHHPRCFTMWMAGGGFKEGLVYGKTDDFSYNVTENPVHVRDFHATVLKLLGIDHERLTYRYQGLDQKLTGVIPARVVDDIIKA
jgi:hypothetical protein